MVAPSIPAVLVSAKLPLLPAAGVTVALLDAAPVPAELVAVTVQVYAVPLVRPVTASGLAAPEAVRVAPPPAQEAV